MKQRKQIEKQFHYDKNHKFNYFATCVRVYIKTKSNHDTNHNLVHLFTTKLSFF